MSETIMIIALVLLYGVGNLIWYILYTTVTRNYQKENKRLRERLAFYQDFLDDMNKCYEVTYNKVNNN